MSRVAVRLPLPPGTPDSEVQWRVLDAREVLLDPRHRYTDVVPLGVHVMADVPVQSTPVTGEQVNDAIQRAVTNVRQTLEFIADDLGMSPIDLINSDLFERIRKSYEVTDAPESTGELDAGGVS